MAKRGRPKKVNNTMVDVNEYEPSTKDIKHLEDIELLNLLEDEDEDDEFFSEDSLGYEYN